MIVKTRNVSEATASVRLNRLISGGFFRIVADTNPFKPGFDITGVIRTIVDIKKSNRINRVIRTGTSLV